jgi:hypothetical protein
MNSGLRVMCVMFTLALACMAQPTSRKAANANATYSIQGKVVDAADGHPVANAEIYLGISAKEMGQQSLLSGPDGAFRATGLPAGKYGVTVEKKGYGIQRYGEQQGYWIGVAVGPGITEPVLTLKLQAESSILGVVRDQDETPIPNATISLFRSELVDGLVRTYEANSRASDQGGSYRFSHLSPGKYYLVVQAKTEFHDYLESAGYLMLPKIGQADSGNEEPSQNLLPPELDVAYPVTFYPNATTSADAQCLHLSPGERLHADFRLQALPAIHVKVPMDINVTFRVQSFGGDELQIEADSYFLGRGEWKMLAIAPGTYRVSMGIDRQENRIYSDAQMELAADVMTDDDQLVDNASRVSGVAVMDDGSPASSHLIISLTPLNSMSIQEELIFNTKEDGKIEWAGTIPPGKYKLSLEDSPLSIKSAAVEGAKIRGRTLDVPGAGRMKLALVLTAERSLVHGKVLSDGKLVAGAMVLLVPEDFENNPQLFFRDESDSDGTFGFPPVPPGNYTAVAIQNGWDLEWAKPEVLSPYLAKGHPLKLVSGATEDITLDLQ